MTEANPKLDVGEQILNPSICEQWMVSKLGLWSSHPRYSSTRLFLLFTVSLMPWVITIAAALYWLTLNADESTGWMIKNGRGLLLWGLVCAGFAAGLGLTGALAIIASRSHAIVADKGTPSVGMWGGFVGVFLLGSLPWLVPMAFNAGPNLRGICALLGVIPFALVVLLILLAPTEDARGRPLITKIRWWTLIFPLGLIGCIMWIRFGGYSEKLATWGPFPQILQTIFERSTQGPIQGWAIDPSARNWIITGLLALLLSPILVLAFILMLLLRDVVVGDSSERRIRKRKSVLERVKKKPLMGEAQTKYKSKRQKLGFNRDGRDVSKENEPDADNSDAPDALTKEDRPPAFISTLQSTVDPELDLGDWVPKRFAVGETAALYAGSESFEEFFGGVTPSMDQVRAFTFIYDQFAKSFEGEHEHSPFWATPTVDVLLQGSPGSGRTTTVIATIVQSAIVRGETVLVLVPNAMKRRSMVRRIRRAAESSGVGWFLNVGDLTERGVETWIEPNDDRKPTTSEGTHAATSAKIAPESFSDVRNRLDLKRERDRLERSAVAPKSTPDILVGTLSDFEDCFFKRATNFIRLREVLRRFELIVVDDLHLFDVTDRIHLRFVLDKLRLIVGSEGMRSQTILVTPILGDTARDFVAEQLLTAKQRIQTLKLRPFARMAGAQEPWEVQLKAKTRGSTGISKTIEKCARACIAAGVEVVVFSPRMTPRERRDLETALEGSGEAEVRVVADLDELEVDDSSQFGAVFYSASNGMGASMAIRAHAGSEDVVVFTILPLHMEQLDRPVLNDLLVLPDGKSRALFAVHLRSAVRFLRRLQPIHRSLWSKFGLPTSGSLRVDINSTQDRPAALLEDREVTLDPPDPIAAQQPRADVWGWCCLAKQEGDSTEKAPNPMSVKIRDMIESGTSIRVAPNADKFSIATIRDSIAAVEGLSERRLAEWFSEDRISIGIEDLAYSGTLRYESDDSAFYPAGFEERDGRDRGAIRIEGALWSERNDSNNTQSYMVGLNVLELKIPADFVHKDSALTALPKNVHLIQSELKPRATNQTIDASTGAVEVSDPLKNRQFVTIEVAATFDELAEVRKQALKVRYEVSTCFLAFNFTPVQLESASIQRDLGGEWGLGRETGATPRTIIPELGAAFTVAMKRHTPGMERLTRCVGVRIDAVGVAPRFALMFFEPLSTDGTTFRLLSKIIRDREFLKEFIGTAASVLEEIRGGRVPPNSIFVRAQISIGATINEDRSLSVNLESVEILADLLREISNAGTMVAPR